MHNYPVSSIINKDELKRKKIVFSENNMRYECINDSNEDVIMLHIDGGLFSECDSELRCDYGFEVDGEWGNRICLIELKGHDVRHACKQLYTTLLFFEKSYPVKKFFCRIVSSKRPNIESLEEKKLSAYLKKRKYGNLKTKTNKISEKLSEIK